MAFSLIGVVSALITLCLKTALLEGVADTEDDANNRQNNEQEFGLDEVPYPFQTAVSRHERFLSGCRALYQLSEYESGTSRYTENPYVRFIGECDERRGSRIGGESDKMKSENVELRRVIDKMCSENEQMRLENEQMRLENEQMRKEMENLRTGHSQEETTNEQPQI